MEQASVNSASDGPGQQRYGDYGTAVGQKDMHDARESRLRGAGAGAVTGNGHETQRMKTPSEGVRSIIIIISLSLSLLYWDQVIPIRSQSRHLKTILLTSIYPSLRRTDWLEINLLGKNSLSPMGSAPPPHFFHLHRYPRRTHYRLHWLVPWQTRHHK